VQSAVPTLNLLLTVRLLADLTARGSLTPDAPARQALLSELRALAALPRLGPSAAQRAQERLLAVLTEPQRAQLAQARTDLDRRARLLAARARFAALDGPVNLSLVLYGFQIPGGLNVVLSLSGDPALNPYLTSAPNAAVLRRLLAALTP
jgi:hypothetical protein